MTACTNRLLGLGLTATLLTGLAGCVGIEEATKIDPKSLPPAAKSANPQAVAAVQPPPGMPVTPTGPVTIEGTTVSNIPVPIPKGGPTIENAQAMNPAAPTIANAQAVKPGGPTIANAMAANAASPAVQAVNAQATAQNVALPPEVEAESAVATTELIAAQKVIPLPKPKMELAYAANPASARFSAIDNQFDTSPPGAPPVIQPKSATSGPGPINDLIKKYAAMYELPESLVHRVVHRESRYNPAAFNRGHYGLMQIKYNTAKSMGFAGSASGLFDAENNLKYAIKYLRGAYLVADRNPDGAVKLYARGYYYDAKRKGMLHVLE